MILLYKGGVSALGSTVAGTAILEHLHIAKECFRAIPCVETTRIMSSVEGRNRKDECNYV